MTSRSPLAPRWLAFGLITLLPAFAIAQGPPPPPPPNRLFEALDADHDGTLSAEEIRNAPQALKGLDVDKDGSLSQDEVSPRRPPRGGPRPEGARPRDEAPPSPVIRNRDGSEQIPLTFRDGHETDPRDRGRPVALVAGALGVTPEVFRDAFSKVQPAPAGSAPTAEHARKNKDVLMAALGPHGITNEQIDRASNHYRYVQSRGEIWPTKAAIGHATVKDGVLVSVVLTEPGSGYTTPPTVTIPGHPELTVEAKLTFSKDLDKNGSIASLKSAKAK